MTVIIRAIGPSLGPLGVPNPLADPVLQLQGDGGVTHHQQQLERLTRNKQIIDSGFRRPMIWSQPFSRPSIRVLIRQS